MANVQTTNETKIIIDEFLVLSDYEIVRTPKRMIYIRYKKDEGICYSPLRFAQLVMEGTIPNDA